MQKNLVKEPVAFKVGDRTVLVHFLVVVGSKLHGLENENSDTDLKGVFTWSKNDLTSVQGQSLQDSLEKTNLKEEVFLDLKEQVNTYFNLGLTEKDDFVLFEARKFVLTATKSDLNLLDMLFASGEFVVFETVDFNALRFHGRKTLLDFTSAKSRFKGMADNTFRRYQSKPHLYKDLARAFHSLFVVKDLLQTGTYNSRLTGDNKYFVMDLKNNRFDFTAEELEAKFNELMNDVVNTEVPENEDFDVNKSNKFLTPLFLM